MKAKWHVIDERHAEARVICPYCGVAWCVERDEHGAMITYTQNVHDTCEHLVFVFDLGDGGVEVVFQT